MSSNAQLDRLKDKLHGLVDTMRVDLDRMELLVAALDGFCRPVPGYEPHFHHLHHRGSLRKYEISGREADRRR